MNQDGTLKQAVASLRMAETLFKAGRASADEVNRAKRRVDELEQLLKAGVPNTPATLAKSPVANIKGISQPTPLTGHPVDQEQYNFLQSEWSKTIDKLNRKMADLSNQLHMVPADTPCPELTKPILDLKARIERVWDSKRYLERNRCLPDVNASGEPATNSSPLEDSQEKMALAHKKRRLIDQRYKLNRKLEDPKASMTKRTKWEIELAQVNVEIDTINKRIETM